MQPAVIGACLTLAGSGGWGWLLARQLQRRPAELAAIQAALGVLRTEIEYRRTPLPTALTRAARGGPAAVRCLLESTAMVLGQGGGVTPGEAWSSALTRADRISAWTTEDLVLLSRLGDALGASGPEDQVRHIEACSRQLRLAEGRARSGLERRARMWLYLGVLVGAALVLVTI